MKYVELGGLDIAPSCVVFGGEQLGGYRWGETSETEMVRAVHVAIDGGVNFFDTANTYGLGHSEELLGKTLGPYRKNIIISTKVGLVWGKDAVSKKPTPNSPIGTWVDNSPANINRQIDMTLKRLNTDYIDIYQIHWPDPKTPVGDTMLALEKIKKAGKIRHVGCCNFPLGLLKESLKYGDIKTIQVPYNLVDRKVEKTLLPFCKENNIGVLTYSPLARGLLGGKYDKNAEFGQDDHRSRSNDEYFQGEAYLQNLEVMERVKLVARKLNRTPAQIALVWVLKNPCVTAAIFGAKTVSQVQENIEINEIALSKEDIESLNGKV